MSTEEKRREFARAASSGVRVPIPEFPKVPDFIRGRSSDHRSAYDQYDKEIDEWRKSLSGAVGSYLDLGSSSSTAVSTSASAEEGVSTEATPGTPVASPAPSTPAPAPTVAISGLRVHVYMAIRSDGEEGTGLEHDPFDASTTARFDNLLRSLPANTTVHLGPGTFKTQGRGESVVDASRYWRIRSGWQIIGSGIGVTIVRLVEADIDDSNYSVIHNYPSLDGYVNDVVVRDLTLDCNLTGQATSDVCVHGISLNGNRNKISRVRCINWGTTSTTSREPVVIGGAKATPTAGFGDLTDFIIEECIVDQPSSATQAHDCTLIGCGGNSNSPASKAISSMVWAASVVTVTTSANHNLVNGQWVYITGASPGGYNGSYQITVTSATTFTYDLTANPGAEVGSPVVEGYTDNGDGEGFLTGLVIRDCYLDAYDLQGDVASSGVELGGVHGALVTGNTVRGCTAAAYQSSARGGSGLWSQNYVVECESGFSWNFGDRTTSADTVVVSGNLIELEALTANTGSRTPHVTVLVNGSTPFAISMVGADANQPLGNQNIFIDGNVIRFFKGEKNGTYVAGAVDLMGSHNAVVTNNIIDLDRAIKIQTTDVIEQFHARGNRSYYGEVVRSHDTSSGLKYRDDKITLGSVELVAAMAL